GRRGPSARRIPLPCVAPARNSQVPGRRMEEDRYRSRCKVLSFDGQRPTAIAVGHRRLAATFGRHRIHTRPSGRNRTMNWRRLFQGRRLEKQLDSELRFHIEARISDLVSSGLSEPEARRMVQLEFGRIQHVKEEVRESWGWVWLERLLQDLRY